MSLHHLDMEGQIKPVIGIDRYASKVGSNDQIVTLDFTVRQKEVGEDLCSWLEKGYDWVIDADTSPGPVEKNKYLVFVELMRRNSVPKHIIEILQDLETLTGLDVAQWQFMFDDQLYPVTIENIKAHLSTSPHEYREEKQGQLNEWRQIAGIPVHATAEYDSELLELQNMAHIIKQK